MTSGFEYRDLVDKLNRLQKVYNDIDDVMEEGVGVLSRRFLKEMKKNSPVDTGHLEASWGFEILVMQEFYMITMFNLALSENGELYMPFVNDGHRIFIRGVDTGLWQEGQFFVEGTEHTMETELIPKWRKNLERRIVRLILNALS